MMGRALGNALNQIRAGVREPKRQPESGLKQTVRQFLEWHKWYVMTVQVGAFGTPGISDLIAIRKGRVLFLEIKTKTGILSEDQREFWRNLVDQGAEYHVVRDIKDLGPLGVT